jgi:O-antigen/teichoic acid export membrane protein
MLARIAKNWLFQSSAIFLGTGVLRGVSQFAFVLIMTRLLRPLDYGVYSNFIYVATLISPILFLRPEVAVARKYGTNPDEIPGYVGTIVGLSSALSLGAIVVLWFSESLVRSMTGIAGFWRFLVIPICWSYGLLLVVQAILQMQYRAWSMSFSRVASSVTCEIAAIVIVANWGGGWRGALAAYVCVSAIWGLLFLGWLSKKGLISTQASAKDARNFLSISVPLVPMAIAFVGVQTAAQFFLTHYRGPEASGLYAAANQFALGVWLLSLSSQQSFLPWLFKALQRDNQEDYFKIVSAVAGIIALLAVATVLYVAFAGVVFPIAVGEKFRPAAHVLGHLAWSNCFLGIQMVTLCFLYFRKRTFLAAALVCIGAIADVGLSTWMIPTGGLLAASIVTELSAAAIATMTMIAAVVTNWKIFQIGTTALFAMARRSFEGLLAR